MKCTFLKRTFEGIPNGIEIQMDGNGKYVEKLEELLDLVRGRRLGNRSDHATVNKLWNLVCFHARKQKAIALSRALLQPQADWNKCFLQNLLERVLLLKPEMVIHKSVISKSSGEMLGEDWCSNRRRCEKYFAEKLEKVDHGFDDSIGRK